METQSQVEGRFVVVPGEAKVKDVERKLILSTLDKFKGNKLKASEALGISRRSLYNKLQRYGVHRAAGA